MDGTDVTTAPGGALSLSRRTEGRTLVAWGCQCCLPPTRVWNAYSPDDAPGRDTPDEPDAVWWCWVYDTGRGSHGGARLEAPPACTGCSTCWPLRTGAPDAVRRSSAAPPTRPATLGSPGHTRSSAPTPGSSIVEHSAGRVGSSSRCTQPSRIGFCAMVVPPISLMPQNAAAPSSS